MQPLVVFDFVDDSVSLQQPFDSTVLAALDRPPGVVATTDSTPPLELPPTAGA